MDVSPSRVSWIGHSFGAATITQFVKSIYYNNALPSLAGHAHEHDEHWRPLYTPSSSRDILKQITPESPVALLDVWTLPLQAGSTQWLWEKPMPCYHRSKTTGSAEVEQGTNTVSVMSTEFCNWEGMRNRTRALLSRKPVEAMQSIDLDKALSPKVPTKDETPTSPRISTPPYKGAEQSLLMTKTDKSEMAKQEEMNDPLPPPSLNVDDGANSLTDSPASGSVFSSLEASAMSSQTDLSVSVSPPDSHPESNPKQSTTQTQGIPPSLFTIPFSAHLSQSDFGLLFPRVVRVLMKAVDPEYIMQLNIRAITQAMRNSGLDVRRVDEGERLEEMAREKRGWGWAWWRAVDVDVKEIEREDREIEREGERWKRLELFT
jgi:hypothetical protein